MKRIVCVSVVVFLVSMPALAITICPPPEELQPANDPTYGYSKKNPIVVGHIGPKNVDAFMALLRGPGGERVSYKRAGSCCTFKTTQALLGDTATLEKYRVTHKGQKKAVVLYFNQYDCGVAKLPDGFSTD